MLARGACRFGSQVAASSTCCQLTFDELRHNAEEVRRRLRGREAGAAVAAVRLDGSTDDLVAVYSVLLAVDLDLGGSPPPALKEARMNNVARNYN